MKRAAVKAGLLPEESQELDWADQSAAKAQWCAPVGHLIWWNRLKYGSVPDHQHCCCPHHHRRES